MISEQGTSAGVREIIAVGGYFHQLDFFSHSDGAFMGEFNIGKLFSAGGGAIN